MGLKCKRIYSEWCARVTLSAPMRSSQAVETRSSTGQLEILKHTLTGNYPRNTARNIESRIWNILPVQDTWECASWPQTRYTPPFSSESFLIDH